jgi:hypothetical protein
MDNGEVLQGLDDRWEFMGANAMEWLAGFVSFILISLFGSSPARSMPFMMIGWISTTTAFATMRRTFPDEHRGMRNLFLSACGIQPPGIPDPARLQYDWSPAPLRDLNRESRFVKLGLNRLFPTFQRDLEVEEAIETPDVLS